MAASALSHLENFPGSTYQSESVGFKPCCCLSQPSSVRVAIARGGWEPRNAALTKPTKTETDDSKEEKARVRFQVPGCARGSCSF